MAIKYELSAKTGTYKNKDGEDKASYVRCGVVLETRNGLAIKLEALPVSFDGWIYMNDPKPKDGESKPTKAKAAPLSDGEIPF
jgi:hypothetical protein